MPATLNYDWSNSISAIHNVPLHRYVSCYILNMQQGMRPITSCNGEEEMCIKKRKYVHLCVGVCVGACAGVYVGICVGCRCMCRHMCRRICRHMCRL